MYANEQNDPSLHEGDRPDHDERHYPVKQPVRWVTKANHHHDIDYWFNHIIYGRSK